MTRIRLPATSTDAFNRVVTFVRDKDNSLTIVAAASIAAGVMWFLTRSPVFSCDTQSYFTWIAGALGQSIPSIFHTIRTGGYPILLMLFGITGATSHSLGFYGILAVQFAMAVAIPVLIFLALRPYNHRIAFVTSLLSIVSLTPYFDSEIILPHQSYKFLLVLLVYLVCGFLRTSSPRIWIVALSLTNALLCIFYPLSALLFPILFLFLIVGRPREWLSLVGGAAIVVVLVASQNLYISSRVPPKGLWTPPVRTLDGASGLLKSRFLDLAFHDLYIARNAKDLAVNRGPARQALRDVLENFAVEFPGHWKTRPPAALFQAFSDKPDAWVDRLYADPNRIYYGMIKDAVLLTAFQGKDERTRNLARGVIGRVVSEVYRQHPLGLITFFYRYAVAPSFGATAERLFYRVFYTDRSATVSEDNGPASREYVAFIKRYLTENPAAWAAVAAKHLPAADRDNLDALIKETVPGSRDPLIFQYGWSGMDEYLGHYKSFSVHAGVLRESIAKGGIGDRLRTYGRLASIMLTDLKAFSFGSFSQLTDAGGAIHCLTPMPWQKTASQAAPAAPGGWFVFERKIWSFFHSTTSWLVVIFFIPCLFLPLRFPIVFTATLILFHGVSNSIYARAQVGDVDQSMPLTILLAGMMACALSSALTPQFAARISASAARLSIGAINAAIIGYRRFIALRFIDVLKFVATNLVLFAILLLGIEFLARSFLPERSIYGVTKPGQYARYHPYLAVTNESSIDLNSTWWDPNNNRHIPYHIKTNRLGFRMGREIDTATKYQKAPNEKVVLIFGSSTVYGFGSTSNETTISGWLQKILNERQRETRYTVLNMANGWWIVYQQLAALQLYGLMLDPDWIIYMDGRNDVFNIGYTFGEEMGIHGSATATRDLVDGYFFRKVQTDFYRSGFENELIRMSAAYRYFSGKQYIPRHQPLIRNEHTLKSLDQNIDTYLRFERLSLLQCPTCQFIMSTQPINRAGRTMTLDDRKKFVAENKDLKIGGNFVATPGWENIIHYSYGRIRDEMPEICAAAGPRCRYKFMDEVFPPKYSEKSKYFVDDVHLTDDGAKLAAEYYASIILNGAQKGPQPSQDKK